MAAPAATQLVAANAVMSTGKPQGVNAHPSDSAYLPHTRGH